MPFGGHEGKPLASFDARQRQMYGEAGSIRKGGVVIGLSLHACIFDIAKGLVDEREVDYIVTATTDNWTQILRENQRLEWAS